MAARILNDQQFFNEAVLGKSPADYASWIKNPQSWGGAIEMMILSDYLKSEIVAVDIMNVRFDTFGEGKGYSQRVYLIYSGIHYDLCVKNFQENGE